MIDLVKTGSLLKEYRVRARKSRAAVSEEVGVSPTYLWMIEAAHERKNGAPSRPSQPMLASLSEALGLGQQEREDLLMTAGYDISAKKPFRTIVDLQLGEEEMDLIISALKAAWSSIQDALGSPLYHIVDRGDLEGKKLLIHRLSDRISIAQQQLRQENDA